MMTKQSDYYYGQGKVYFAPYMSGTAKWHWVGDVSSMKLNFEFDEQYSKRSIAGRLVNHKRFITFTGGNITATWFERSFENLELMLYGTSATRKQSWQRERLNGITAGMTILLKQNIRDITIDGLIEYVDFVVNYELGSIQFITTPVKQPFIVEYDYSSVSGVGILNSSPVELAMRYDGINLANEYKPIFIELYRLSIDLVETISLIDSKSEFSSVETVMQLLPDGKKSPKSDFGLFGRIYKTNKFNTIYCNDEIIANDEHYAAY